MNQFDAEDFAVFMLQDAVQDIAWTDYFDMWESFHHPDDHGELSDDDATKVVELVKNAKITIEFPGNDFVWEL